MRHLLLTLLLVGTTTVSLSAVEVGLQDSLLVPPAPGEQQRLPAEKDVTVENCGCDCCDCCCEYQLFHNVPSQVLVVSRTKYVVES